MSYFCSNAQKEEKWLFLKDALWGGGGTHRSWPGGRGGRGDDCCKEEGVREGLAWRSGGCKGFGCGGVGGRGTGPRDGANFATCVVFLSFLTCTKKKKNSFFLKDALWGGGGTHQSWPGGRGGRPRALIPGEGVREGLAWRGKAGHQPTEPGLVDGGSGRRSKGSGGGARASVPGG